MIDWYQGDDRVLEEQEIIVSLLTNLSLSPTFDVDFVDISDRDIYMSCDIEDENKIDKLKKKEFLLETTTKNENIHTNKPGQTLVVEISNGKIMFDELLQISQIKPRA